MLFDSGKREICFIIPLLMTLLFRGTIINDYSKANMAFYDL